MPEWFMFWALVALAVVVCVYAIIAAFFITGDRDQ